MGVVGKTGFPALQTVTKVIGHPGIRSCSRGVWSDADSTCRQKRDDKEYNARLDRLLCNRSTHLNNPREYDTIRYKRPMAASRTCRLAAAAHCARRSSAARLSKSPLYVR